MAQRNILAAQFDAALELHNAGALTAAGFGSVGGSPRVVNVGTGILDATLIVDVDSMDLSSSDEIYEIVLQGSTSADFTSGVATLTSIRVGKASATGNSSDSVVGRIARRFLNSATGAEDPNGPPSGGLPYLRIKVTPGGTTPSIAFRAFVTKDTLAA